MLAGKLGPHLEAPERCERMVKALRGASYVVEAPREDIGLDAIARVHVPGYLEFLSTAWERWSSLKNAGPEVLPNVHPYRGAGDDLGPRKHPRAASPVAQASWYLGDLACPIGPHTWEWPSRPRTPRSRPPRRCSRASTGGTRCAVRRGAAQRPTVPAAQGAT